MALTGAQKVAEANRQALSGQTGGAVTTSGQIVNASGKVVGGASSVSPKDSPSYVAGSSADDKVGPITQMNNELASKLNLSEDQTALVAPKNNLQPKTQTNAGNAFTGNGLKLSPTLAGGATSAPNLSQQYNQTKTALDQSGVTTPQNTGAGSAMVNTALKGYAPQQEPPSIVGEIMETDNNFDSILTDYDEYFKPQNQRKSLLEEYKSMESQLGISGLNAEIIDAKRILEGSEEDIRNEITAVGGLATESQVMALSNARNKSLLKNYQTLVDSRDNAMTQLNTMMNLSVQDRQFAEAEFDRKMGFAFKVQEFKQRATDNARSGLQWAITNGAGAEILKSPYETSLVEKTLGIPSGGLAGIVQRQQAELQGVGNIYGTISGKPQNQSQLAANSFANRLSESDVVIANLGSKFTGKSAIGGSLPNIFQSGDRQAYEQAKRNFITAVLRRESGASISPTEFDTAEKLYFPQAGDKPETVTQKEKTRNTAINNFYKEADINRPVMPGQIIQSGNVRYRVGLDGETLEKI